ncbi:MAG: UDP-3-O-acyl-N-acetylglucosamine deacetylase [Desulfurivibrionaceae bacterium]
MEKNRQHTLNKTVSFAGVGLHSGKPVKMRVKPARESSGITFYRTDKGVAVPALFHQIADTNLATTIAQDEVRIGTTEHLLAALHGMGIDNAVIELDSEEVPIMDGSAGAFVRLFDKVKLKKQQSRRLVARIKKDIVYSNGDSELRLTPGNGFRINCSIDFSHALIQKQSLSLDLSPESFDREIARARTFGFLHEIDYLRKNGKALGGSLENALVIDRDGLINEGGLRFSDEFVRHKMLDLIGDIALFGFPIQGHLTARKTGHKQHFQFLQAIVANSDCWDLVEMKDDRTVKSENRKESHILASPWEVSPATSVCPL